MDRREIVYHASQEAAEARADADLEQDTPIAIFEAAEVLGAKVVFVDIDMEGIYERVPSPLILLSPYRPLVRRAFNCAHELGHHRFGHGSTVDELKAASSNKRASQIPEELSANSFAGFILMPAIAIQRAFHRRRTTPTDAPPGTVYEIASDFGVGYRTLVSHLAYGLREIGEARRHELEKWQVQDLRRMILGHSESAPLRIVGENGESSKCDIEVGSCILAPHDSVSTSSHLRLERQNAAGKVFRAVCQGRAVIELNARNVDVQIMRSKYVGLARYRFLEASDDQS